LRFYLVARYDRQPLMFFHICALLLTLSVIPGSPVYADLMDDYLSLPGSYRFVRRAPEGATENRVLVTVFEDFLCPSCYHMVTELLPKIQKKYQDRLAVQFFAYPLVHAESILPARAHAIAQTMGLGEQMQQALFRAHFEEQIDTTNRSGLARVAHSIGLDPDLLLSRLDKGEGKAEIEKNLTLGQTYRLDAVPSLVFDGWIMAKDLTQENLEKIIDGLLARKGGAAKKGPKTGQSKKK